MIDHTGIHLDVLKLLWTQGNVFNFEYIKLM